MPDPSDVTSFQDVLKLIELIKSSSNFSEIRLRTGNVEVELRRHGASRILDDTSPASSQPTPAIEPRPAAAAPQSAPAPATAPQAAPARKPIQAKEGAQIVKSPMVGTAYRAPDPGALPFVSVGQTVRAGQQLCIVEVMKLMNAITADNDGVIDEILFDDAASVQHEQPLFVISPH